MCVGGEEVFVVVHGSCVGLVLVSTGWYGELHLKGIFPYYPGNATGVVFLLGSPSKCNPIPSDFGWYASPTRYFFMIRHATISCIYSGTVSYKIPPFTSQMQPVPWRTNATCNIFLTPACSHQLPKHLETTCRGDEPTTSPSSWEWCPFWMTRNIMSMRIHSRAAWRIDAWQAHDVVQRCHVRHVRTSDWPWYESSCSQPYNQVLEKSSVIIYAK